MTELGEGSKWKVTWAEEDEFAEYVARGLAEILSRHNPYQNSDRHNLEYQFTCRLIRGRDVHPHYDREDDYFMSIRIFEKNWDYTKEHNPAHINMYGHEWEDMVEFMHDTLGFELNSFSLWGHTHDNFSRHRNTNLEIEPCLDFLWVMRELGGDNDA